MCFICAAHTNIGTFKRFPDSAGTHGHRDPINVAESSTRPKIPNQLQSGLNTSYWHWDYGVWAGDNRAIGKPQDSGK